jgi:hypothetical protein
MKCRKIILDFFNKEVQDKINTKITKIFNQNTTLFEEWEKRLKGRGDEDEFHINATVDVKNNEVVINFYPDFIYYQAGKEMSLKVQTGIKVCSFDDLQFLFMPAQCDCGYSHIMPVYFPEEKREEIKARIMALIKA